MASTREQLDAHAFDARRRAVALLGRPPSDVDPRRRLNRGLLTGLVVGLVTLAAIAAIGLLRVGHSSSALPGPSVAGTQPVTRPTTA